MTSSATVITIIVSYFVLMFGIGYWANRRTKSSKEFLVAGQSLGFFVMAIASFSSIQSGWGMVGNTGAMFDVGIAALLSAAFLVPLGFTLAWFLLGARLHKVAQEHEVYSIPDLVKLRYKSRPAHIALSVAMVIGAVAYMTSQISAMGIISSLLLGTSIQTGAWIGAAVVALYTIAGGMLAAVWTDLIQGLLMIAMSVFIFFTAIELAGGWLQTLDTINLAEPGHLMLIGGNSDSYFFGYAVLLLFGAAGQPQLITKFLMLRDSKELKWGATVSGIAYGVTTLFSLGIGLALKAMVIDGRSAPIDNIDETTTVFLSEFTNPVIAALALTALLAAIMSSASSFITIGAAAVVRDFVGSVMGRSVKNELLWSRVWSGIITVASVLLVFYLSQVIFILGAFGWAAFAAAILGPIGLGIYWRKATGNGALWGIITAMGLNFVVTLIDASGVIEIPDHIHIGGVSMVVAVLVFVVVSALSRQQRNDALFDQFYGVVPAAQTQAGSTAQSVHPGSVVAPIRALSDRRMNIAIGVIAACMLLMGIGMVFDVPGLIFYPVPIVFALFLLLGGINLEGKLEKVVPGLVAYSVIFGALFIWMVVARESTTIVWGLPISSAILVYIIWPFTVLTSGALYAWVYQTWLSKSNLNRTETPGEPQTLES